MPRTRRGAALAGLELRDRLGEPAAPLLTGCRQGTPAPGARSDQQTAGTPIGYAELVRSIGLAWQEEPDKARIRRDAVAARPE